MPAATVASQVQPLIKSDGGAVVVLGLECVDDAILGRDLEGAALEREDEGGDHRRRIDHEELLLVDPRNADVLDEHVLRDLVLQGHLASEGADDVVGDGVTRPTGHVVFGFLLGMVVMG